MQALAWHAEDVPDADDDDKLKYKIKIFGLDRQNRSMSVTVHGFPPHFFVKAEDGWTGPQMRSFATYTCNELLKGLDAEPYDRKGKDFWGFTNKKEFKFLRLAFPSLQNMRRAVAILGKHKKLIKSMGMFKPYTYQVYESNIEPYLRFIHLRGIEPCGWIDFVGPTPATDVLETTCAKDIEVNFSKVVPMSGMDGQVVKFLVASFDIECMSMGGEFPVPQKDYRMLVTQLLDLSNTLKKAGASDYDTKVKIKAAILYSIYGTVATEDSVSRVEPKDPPSPTVLSKYLDEMIVDDLVSLLRSGTNRDKTVTLATAFMNRAKLLPKLHGDRIIQIGTTFHRYGETVVSRRVIVTLGTCSPIEGVEVIEAETEAKLLLKWREIMLREDPDIVTGYNIYGFDFNYMVKRAAELGVSKTFLQLSRLKGRVCNFVEQKLSSSALGDNVLKFIEMKGRVSVDLMKVIQRDHKLDSYKLDNVAYHFTKQKKMDVSPHEIFALQKGTAADRSKIASYCIQDCALCNHLVMKLEIVANNLGMSNVCLVPMEYIFLRGQGIKIFSLLLNECTKEKFLIPCVKRELSVRTEDIESLEPVASREDRSKIVKAIDATAASLLKTAKASDAMDVLKPSAVTAAILSLASREHHVEVGLEHLQKKFMYLQRGDFETACRILTSAAVAATAAAAASAKAGGDPEEGVPDDDSYEGAIVLDPKQGIYIDDPISVLDYASLYPNSMISENLSHDCLVLDPAYDNLPGVEYLNITYDLFDEKRQKVGEHTCRFAQSEMGIIPKILKKLLAARKSTRKKMTYIKGLDATGQEVIGTRGGPDAIVTPEGDRVPVDPDTIKPAYDSFQIAVLDGLQSAYKVTANSLYGQIGARTSQIYLKEIAACTTATGRSMILKAKEFLESKPGVEVIYGDSVTGYTPVLLRDQKSIEVAKIEDIADRYGGGHWIPCSGDKEACELEDVETWTSSGWTKLHRVIRHELAPHKKILRILTHTGVVDVTDEHSLMDENHQCVDAKAVRPGDRLLHHDLPVGYFEGDQALLNRMWKDRFSRDGRDTYTYDFPDQLTASSAYLMASLIAGVDLLMELTEEGAYRIKMTRSSSNCDDTTSVIKKIEEVHGYSGYVYDLTTENHEFAAGVGRIIVHNTDSIFVRFPSEKTRKEKIMPSIQMATEASAEFRKLIKAPHDLEYEKTFWPFILLSKKRYVGNLYEHDDEHFKQKSMGIVLKRRDNAQIVKKIYGGVLEIILDRQDVPESVKFLEASLLELVTGKTPIEDLVVTKSLRADYKDPLKIAHKVLADRMAERDPGSKLQSSERVPYVYVVTPAPEKGRKQLQGEKIETPAYIKEKGLVPDYGFYITNQIMKPLLQLYSLVIEQLPGYDHPPDYFDKIEAKLNVDFAGDEDKVKDKLEVIKEVIVKRLLFDPMLVKLEQKIKKSLIAKRYC